MDLQTILIIGAVVAAGALVVWLLMNRSSSSGASSGTTVVESGSTGWDFASSVADATPGIIDSIAGAFRDDERERRV